MDLFIVFKAPVKKIFIFSIFSVFAACSFSQISLSFSKNSLVAGDSNGFREIQYIEPGNTGPNQIWDFSKIQFTGKILISRMPPVPSQELDGVGKFNILLSDDGNEYYYYLNGDGIEEKGFTSKEKKLTMVYSDPVLKVKYPFSFGQQFNDKYAGIGMMNKTSRVDVSGDYTVTADAFGTLIMPDRVVRNTLRIKTVNKGLQINKCGSTEIYTERYLWYADGYRYPVLSISVMESRRSGKSQCVTRTAYVNLKQKNENIALPGSGQSEYQTDDTDVSVILFPNPFNEKLTYNYFLRKPAPVTIDLYDMSGKVKVHLLKNQVQEEGLHTGELAGATYGLPPGVYYFRFTFDRKVIVSRVIKYD
jgi:hypothetical protein